MQRSPCITILTMRHIPPNRSICRLLGAAVLLLCLSGQTSTTIPDKFSTTYSSILKMVTCQSGSSRNKIDPVKPLFYIGSKSTNLPLDTQVLPLMANMLADCGLATKQRSATQSCGVTGADAPFLNPILFQTAWKLLE